MGLNFASDPPPPPPVQPQANSGGAFLFGAVVLGVVLASLN
jgi:hypothetical protein